MKNRSFLKIYLSHTDYSECEVQNSDRDIIQKSKRKKHSMLYGTVRFDYMQRNNFRLYRKAGVGFIYYDYLEPKELNKNFLDDDVNEDIIFSGQLNPIGFSYETKKIGGYAELGIGTRELIETDIFLRL